MKINSTKQIRSLYKEFIMNHKDYPEFMKKEACRLVDLHFKALDNSIGYIELAVLRSRYTEKPKPKKSKRGE